MGNCLIGQITTNHSVVDTKWYRSGLDPGISGYVVQSDVGFVVDVVVVTFVTSGEYLEEGLVLQIVWIYQVISSEKWRFLDTDSQNELRLIWNK